MKASDKKLRKRMKPLPEKKRPVGPAEVQVGVKGELETTVESKVPKLSSEEKARLEARERMKTDILKRARENPDEIAKLLLNWLKGR